MANHNRAALNRLLRQRERASLGWIIVTDIKPSPEEAARRAAEDADIRRRREAFGLH
jgi:hypothetical protein